MPPADTLLDRYLANLPPVRHRATAWAATPAQQRRFLVSVTFEDGRSHNYQVTGGSACEHAQDAQEAAGIGAVVRVLPLQLAEVAP